MNDNKLIWLEKGYEIVATEGFDKLKIEKLSKLIGISKSSFYHLFVDFENYIFLLLEFHLEKCRIISEKEYNAKSIDPDLIEILINHKLDILFNRQLRIYGDNQKFNEIIIKINELVSIPFIIIWKRDLKLKLDDSQLNGLFSLVLENFFLQLNFENLESVWLTNYFNNLKILIRSIAL